MTDNVLGVINDVASALSAGGDPTQVRAAVAAVASRHPEASLGLVVDTEAFDERNAYHVSIRIAGEPGWSVARDAEGGLPWPLRGVVRSSDGDLVRVGEHLLTVGSAIGLLDHVWADNKVGRRVVDAALVEQAIDERGIALTDLELQRAVDAFRRGKGLHQPAATLAWLTEHGLAMNGLIELARGSALIARLRRDILAETPDADVTAAHEAVGDITVAWRERDDVGPWDGSPAVVVAEAQAGRHCGISTWHAEEMPEGFDDLLTSPVGSVVEVAGGRLEASVLARRTASDSPAVRARVEQVVFERWLSMRRTQVEVEWLWGVNAVTRPSARAS